MVVLEVVAWLAGIVAALALLVLVVPIRVTAAGKLRGLRPSGSLEALWGYGVVGFHARPGEPATLKIFGIPVRRFRKKEEKRPEPEGEKRKKPRKKSRRGLRWLWRNRHTFRELWNRAVRSLALQLKVTGCIGVGDPADTAQLQLLLQWAASASQRIDASELSLDWTDEVIEIQLTARARVWPAGLLAIFLSTFLRRKVRRAWKAV